MNLIEKVKPQMDNDNYVKTQRKWNLSLTNILIIKCKKANKCLGLLNRNFSSNPTF